MWKHKQFIFFTNDDDHNAQPKQKGRSILMICVQCSSLASHALNQHANRHTTRVAVRVEQDVGHHTCLAEWQAFKWPQKRVDTYRKIFTDFL